MTDKQFIDMNSIERRNRYERTLWFRAAEKIKRNGVEEPVIESTDPVDYSKLLGLFRSNSSLYGKLSDFMRVTGVDEDKKAWLVSNNVYSSFANSSEKLQFQNNQIISTLETFIDEDFSEFSPKDVDKILKAYDDLNKEAYKYFNKIEYELSNSGVSSSLVSSHMEAQGSSRLEPAIKNINNKLFKQHAFIDGLLGNYSSRKEVIGSGAIPRKYM